MRIVNSKSTESIADEWNELIERRDEISNKGIDISLRCVNLPCIMNQLLLHCDLTSVLDVGCGAGYLSSVMSEHAGTVVGIDISSKSIDIASKRYCELNNVKFFTSSICNYIPTRQHTTCTANMVFMTDPNYLEDVRAINQLLCKGGSFVFSITHPSFWPLYQKYITEPWFNYSKECYIEGDFKTSLSDIIGVSTHIHRPLEFYLNGLINEHFNISEISEPYPASSTPAEYNFDFPRFLHIRCTKQ